MRLFIAVTIPEEIRKRVGRLLVELKASAQRLDSQIKWVEPENCHLTLQFLGECAEERLGTLTRALDETARNVPPFAATLGGLGAFPERGAPHVIWLGVTSGEERIRQVAGAIEERVEPLGFPRESRPFSAHLTLGRVRASKNPFRLREMIGTTKVDTFPKMAGDGVALIQSVLSPSGPTYTVVHTSLFKREASGGLFPGPSV